jgi:hypothetical protein
VDGRDKPGQDEKENDNHAVTKSRKMLAAFSVRLSGKAKARAATLRKCGRRKDRDGRVKPGHDGGESDG